METTLEGAPRRPASDAPAVPGIVVVFSDGRPVLLPMRLEGGRLPIGREMLAARGLNDTQVSREHANIEFDTAASRWTITDRGSRNGTFVDGVRVGDVGCGRGSAASVTAESPRVVRVGRTLLFPTADARRYELVQVATADGRVQGPVLRRALEAVARAAKSGDTLLVTGESGAGKEGAAKAFHDAGPRPTGPFVPVNCATVAKEHAEAELFGVAPRTFTQVAERRGHVRAAEGGTLFLDEVGELDLDVQAKLLRLIETHEVTAVGTSIPRPVDVRICLATHRDLRLAAANGHFRRDLYFRIARQHVGLPPLRERAEEIPWLVALAVARVGEVGERSFTSDRDGTLVEACLLRPWPGNVRELLNAVEQAARRAASERAPAVLDVHMDRHAGFPLEASPGHVASTPRGRAALASPTPTLAAAPPSPDVSDTPDALDTKEAIEAIFRAHEGNVVAMAKTLGMHRTQVYRLLDRFGLRPSKG